MLFLHFLLFIVLFFITFYLPGRYLLRIFRFSQPDAISNLTFAVGIGVGFFLLFVYALAFIQMQYVYYIFLLYCFFQESPRVLLEIKQRKHKILMPSFPIGIILIGSAVSLSLVWFSGIISGGAMQLYDVNAVDGIFHISLIEQITNHFPPQTPDLAGIPFRGYHFFFDFLVGEFSLLFPIFSAFDLFFRFFSFFLVLFFGFSGLVLAKHIKLSKSAMCFFLFLLYFAQNSRLLMSVIVHMPLGAYDSGIVQGFQNIFDPSVLFGISFLFILIPIFFSAKTKRQLFLASLLIGILPTVKIYIAIMVYVALFIVSVIFLLRDKDRKYLYTVIVGICIGGFVYLPLNSNSGGLLFAPLLLYRHFVEGSVALAPLQWALKLQIYTMHHNIPRIFSLYAIALFWYFIPTLNIRLISLKNISILWKKKFYSASENIFWLIIISVGFILPTFFIQSVGVFNVFQFLWLDYLLLLIPTASVLGNLYAQKHVYMKIVILLLVVLFSLPDSILFLQSFYSNPPNIVPRDIVQMGKKIQHYVPKNNAIMVINWHSTVPLLSALSQRAVYIEQVSLDNSNAEKIAFMREQVLQSINESFKKCTLNALSLREIGKKTNTQYLFVYGNSDCLPKENLVEKIGNTSLYSL